MCNKHYQMHYKYNDATKKCVRDQRPAIIEGNIAKIPLGLDAKDGYAIVDKELAWIDKYQWLKLNIGYANSSVHGYLHHKILPKKEGFFVDHINRNKMDNRRSNLRYVTHKQSAANTKTPKGSKSPYKGVIWSSQKDKWVSQVSSCGKRYHLGTFSDQEEAARAYDKRAKELWGEYAYLNFPD